MKLKKKRRKYKLRTISRDEILAALEEKGYDPVSQIVGYILSEDPAYITSYMNARGLITKYDRDELLEALVHFYFWANRES